MGKSSLVGSQAGSNRFAAKKLASILSGFANETREFRPYPLNEFLGDGIAGHPALSLTFALVPRDGLCNQKIRRFLT